MRVGWDLIRYSALRQSYRWRRRGRSFFSLQRPAARCVGGCLLSFVRMSHSRHADRQYEKLAATANVVMQTTTTTFLLHYAGGARVDLHRSLANCTAGGEHCRHIPSSMHLSSYQHSIHCRSYMAVRSADQRTAQRRMHVDHMRRYHGGRQGRSPHCLKLVERRPHPNKRFDS